MKYWTLSFKLEALMQREQQISTAKRTLIKLLYLILELMIFCGGIMQLTYPIIYYKGDDRRSLMWAGFGMLLLVSVISLAFVCDGFRRLNRLLNHNVLGISKKQITMHIGSFIIATIGQGLPMFEFAQGFDVESISDLESGIVFSMYGAASCIVLIALATSSILYIINSLLK